MKNVNYIKTSVAFRLLLAILCIGFVLFLSSCQNNAKNDVVYMTTSSSQSRDCHQIAKQAAMKAQRV